MHARNLYYSRFSLLFLLARAPHQGALRLWVSGADVVQGYDRRDVDSPEYSSALSVVGRGGFLLQRYVQEFQAWT